jgi:hypothetical protein
MGAVDQSGGWWEGPRQEAGAEAVQDVRLWVDFVGGADKVLRLDVGEREERERERERCQGRPRGLRPTIHQHKVRGGGVLRAGEE